MKNTLVYFHLDSVCYKNIHKTKKTLIPKVKSIHLMKIHRKTSLTVKYNFSEQKTTKREKKYREVYK